MDDRLKALRDCCRDEAAFDRLKQILGCEMVSGVCEQSSQTDSSLPHLSLPNFSAPSDPRRIAQGRALVADLMLRIRQSLDLQQILTTTVEEVRRILQVDRVFIGYMQGPQRGEVVAESVAAEFPSIKNWVLDQDYLQEIRSFHSQGEICTVEDTRLVEETPFLREYHQSYQVKAGIGIPILLGDEFFGVLMANMCSSPRRWQAWEVDLMTQLANQVAIALQQAHLYQQLAQLNASLEQQVQERTAQLQEQSRLKDVVFHTVIHDLRTSVMGTIMVLKNLLSSTDSTQQDSLKVSRSLIERMFKASEQHLATINSLLETHHPETSGLIGQLESVQLTEWIPLVFQELQQKLSCDRASFKLDIPPHLPPVSVDPDQLARVLESLLTSALHFNSPDVELTFRAQVEGTMVRCTLADNGWGLSQWECDRLFNLAIHSPQARCSTRSSVKLYLCRQMIRALGGQMGATSHPQTGTMVWFTLPCQLP